MIDLVAKDSDMSAAKKVIIWGAGNTFFYYEKIFSYEGIQIKYVVDSDPQKIGSELSGVKVYPPSIIADGDTVLIVTTNPETYKSIAKYLSEINNITYYLFDEYILNKNIHAIQEVADCYEDELSKKQFISVVRSRIAGQDVPETAISNKDLRYNDGSIFSNNYFDDVIIDAGAFCGDTLEKFLFDHEGVFRKYYAFEPDVRNYRGLLARKKRLVAEWGLVDDAIITVPMCLSDTAGKAMFRNWSKSGLGSSLCSEEYLHNSSLSLSLSQK